MSAADLAALHARCFEAPRPYTADEISGFLADPACFLIGDSSGFAIGQVVLDEAELLTLAVDPDRRRRGVGREILQSFLRTAQKRGARRVFLEVASANEAGIGLYQTAGFAEIGRRKGYYRAGDGTTQDAIVMQIQLAEA